MNTRGSEWKKWDLHVHAPGTKMNDGYKIKYVPQEYIESINKEYENYYRDKECKPLKNEDIIWFYWIHIIHNSDVQVIGVTDYFSLDSYITAERYYQEYIKIHKQDKKQKKYYFQIWTFVLHMPLIKSFSMPICISYSPQISLPIK